MFRFACVIVIAGLCVNVGLVDATATDISMGTIILFALTFGTLANNFHSNARYH